jgi:transketolase
MARIVSSYAVEEVMHLESMAYILRHHVVESTSRAGSGHLGGSLSPAEILTTLYFDVMRINPSDPKWRDRDRFVLSKGHAAPMHYSALAERGYFPADELTTLRQLDSRLQGHDSMSTPGIDFTTGSLGQGLSGGIGIALAGRLDRNDCRVYVLLGDGECDEGQTWEAAMFASHHKIDNLTAIVDYNKLQLDGWNKEVMNLMPLSPKWESFGWHTIKVNGHDTTQLLNAFDEAKKIKGKPTVVIANTTKGSGISFVEDNVEYHGKVLDFGSELYNKALDELEKKLNEYRIYFLDRKNKPFYWECRK